MAAGNTQAANFECILGTTGCGKSTVLKKRMKPRRHKRTLICSPKEAIDNYASFFPGSVVTRSTEEVRQILSKAGARGSFHIVFIPPFNKKQARAAFSLLCKFAIAARNLAFIAEELHIFTDAGNASEGWAMLCFMGRGFGVFVYGVSQRPASLDKDFMASLSWLHIGELPHPPDQKVAAEYVGLDKSEIAALCGYQAIQYEFRTKTITRKK